MRILLVEDDATLAQGIARALRAEHFVVDVADNGEDGSHLGSTERYDAAVLDLGLPVRDGVSVLREWRREGRELPVLILTARDGWSEKVAGFKAGADDYLTKPFRMEEVVMRLRALVRRSAGPCRILHRLWFACLRCPAWHVRAGRLAPEADRPRMARAVSAYAAP